MVKSLVLLTYNKNFVNTTKIIVLMSCTRQKRPFQNRLIKTRSILIKNFRNENQTL